MILPAVLKFWCVPNARCPVGNRRGWWNEQFPHNCVFCSIFTKKKNRERRYTFLYL